jgi:hypothetical protein
MRPHHAALTWRQPVHEVLYVAAHKQAAVAVVVLRGDLHRAAPHTQCKRIIVFVNRESMNCVLTPLDLLPVDKEAGKEQQSEVH